VITADEVEREFIDQKIDKTAKTFSDLGMEPADISSFTFHYLVSFSSFSEILLSNTGIARLSERSFL
jgi:NADH dehydrogenase (ubiquinone) 1 alpha subcomplex subunit 9